LIYCNICVAYELGHVRTIMFALIYKTWLEPAGTLENTSSKWRKHLWLDQTWNERGTKW